ncbi:PadR family transcriptional regulator [Amycolatopsis sp. NPDC051373]|uniref:PadR family transcriptional regulator n=1 Tax=Amycolatopsis sp. NPDC051373 TaxID=3155801 RepID=UPI00344BA431
MTRTAGTHHMFNGFGGPQDPRNFAGHHPARFGFTHHDGEHHGFERQNFEHHGPGAPDHLGGHHGGPPRGGGFGFTHHGPGAPGFDHPGAHGRHHPGLGGPHTPGESARSGFEHHGFEHHGPSAPGYFGGPEGSGEFEQFGFGEHHGVGHHGPGAPDHFGGHHGPATPDHFAGHHGPGHFGDPGDPFGFAPDAARGPGGFPPPPPMPPVPPGPGFPGGPGFGGFQGFQGFPGGPRAWFGDGRQWGGRGSRGPARPVRPAVLALLAEGPMHGYQLMQEIRRRSNEEWRPSPGSIYPILQQLEDEGFVRSAEEGGRRVAQLTEAGREHVAGREEEFAALWASHAPEDDPAADRFAALHKQLGDLWAAAGQVAYTGTDSQAADMRKILADARRRLYALLAEDQDDPED